MRWVAAAERGGSWGEAVAAVVRGVSDVVVGKPRPVRLAVACLMARGHLLIEDLPGVGKTLLAHALARVLGLQFQRIQFTSDLLPSDILGAAVWDPGRTGFVFHPGPIFAQVVLADEVNRAAPKTQSALLEAMEERQVTADGATRPLPTPFFVIATQNPAEQVGTFPLPESQLDRFLMRVHLGYPEPAAERRLLEGPERRDLLAGLEPCLAPAELERAQRAVPEVHAAPALLDYLQALLAATRAAPDLMGGLSPRAGVALLRAAQAWAMGHGREYVLPEDVQAVFPAVAGHRLVVRPDAAGDAARQGPAAQRILDRVPIP